jgi:hypothetical protein
MPVAAERSPQPAGLRVVALAVRGGAVAGGLETALDGSVHLTHFMTTRFRQLAASTKFGVYDCREPMRLFGFFVDALGGQAHLLGEPLNVTQQTLQPDRGRAFRCHLPSAALLFGGFLQLMPVARQLGQDLPDRGGLSFGFRMNPFPIMQAVLAAAGLCFLDHLPAKSAVSDKAIDRKVSRLPADPPMAMISRFI